MSEPSLTLTIRAFTASRLALVAGVGLFPLVACRNDATNPPPPPNTWTQKASLPDGPLAGAVSSVIRDKLYVGTGLRNAYTNSFYEYDLTNDRWTAVASFPGGVRANGIAFAIGDYGYVGLGYNCLGAGLCTHHYFNDLWRYDPQTNLWMRMADFPGTARAYATSFVIGQKAYVTGGSRVDDYDLWEYDAAANRWTRKADYAGQCVGRGTAFSLAGKGYVGLGYTDGQCDDFWRYDPTADSWTEIATFPGPARYDALGFTAVNRPFIVGGGQGLTDVWTYNPASNAWGRAQTSYPGNGRSQMVAGVLAGRIVLGLGTNDDLGGPANRFDDLWEYTPEPP